MKLKKPKIVIVHDSIQYWGGAEKVLLALHKTYPDAPIITATISWKNIGMYADLVKSLPIKTTWLQKIPYFPEKPFLYRYLLPFVWKSLDLRSFDVIISSSGSQMSHLVSVSKNQKHVCYCYTPPRHLYGLTTDYNWKKNIVLKLIASILNIYLRWVDLGSVEHVHQFIACSLAVKQRIKDIYHKDAVVIYPPVEVQRKLKLKKKNFYLVVSRLSRMKHIDVIIRAFNILKLPLVIVGVGPEQKYLQSIAKSNTIFLGQVDDDVLYTLYAQAKALICAAEDEDFGITPVESTLLNTPVIAYRSGGYKETVIDCKNGLLYNDLNMRSILLKINLCLFKPIKFKNLKYFTNKFSYNNFHNNMIQIISN